MWGWGGSELKWESEAFLIPTRYLQFQHRLHGDPTASNEAYTSDPEHTPKPNVHRP